MEKIILKGISVYTSDELKEKLKKFISKQGSSSSIDILIKLVDNETLVPVINEPSVLKQLIMKIRRQKPLTNILGAATKGVGYVVFHDSLPGLKLSSYVVKTSLHEMMHVAFQKFPEKFSKINFNIYEKFYSYLYKDFFETKTYDKELFEKFLTRFIKDSIEGITYWETYSKLLRLAFINHTSLPKDSINQRIELLMNTVEDLLDNNPVNRYNLLIALIRKTYRSLFTTFDYLASAGQELYVPSEIISILSTINPDHNNVIKSLKLLL